MNRGRMFTVCEISVLLFAAIYLGDQEPDSALTSFFNSNYRYIAAFLFSMIGSDVAFVALEVARFIRRRHESRKDF